MKTTLKLLFALIISVSILQLSCKKDEEKDSDVVDSAKLATVLTTAVTSIHTTFCTTGGNITDIGESEITMRGVCYSQTETAPTITTNDGITTNGSGSGVYTSKPAGLQSGTKYFLRAYATNTEGTAYGATVNFTTTSK